MRLVDKQELAVETGWLRILLAIIFWMFAGLFGLAYAYSELVEAGAFKVEPVVLVYETEAEVCLDALIGYDSQCDRKVDCTAAKPRIHACQDVIVADIQRRTRLGEL